MAQDDRGHIWHTAITNFNIDFKLILTAKQAVVFLLIKIHMNITYIF